MRPFVPAVALALAACSGSPVSNSIQADVNAAAAEAQGDIDTYAANTLADRPPVAGAAPPRPAASASAAVPRPPATPNDDVAGAADVARTYFALIEAGNYARAYGLWEDGGAASGMSPRQFADSFARYASYRSAVGMPGLVEAGAGQRYVEVPVRVTGTLAESGRPFVLVGRLTLHRTVVDGASAEQRAWRIRESALRPRPDRTPAEAAARGPACAGETRVSARSDEDGDRAAVWQRGDRRGMASEGRDDGGAGYGSLAGCGDAVGSR